MNLLKRILKDLKGVNDWFSGVGGGGKTRKLNKAAEDVHMYAFTCTMNITTYMTSS